MLYAAIEDLRVIDGAVVRAVQSDLTADLPTLATTPTPVPAPEPTAKPRATPDPATDPATDPAVLDRLAMLEARVEQQDQALRRVLTLLVEWVEGDEPRPDYKPIRGASHWHDAA